jgi:hypothetical protein
MSEAEQRARSAHLTRVEDSARPHSVIHQFIEPIVGASGERVGKLEV